MIGIVFKKEMQSHLLSQRFAACTVLAVVLIIANGVLATQTYVHKKASYLTQRAIEETKLHEITYYSVLRSRLARRPARPTAISRAWLDRRRELAPRFAGSNGPNAVCGRALRPRQSALRPLRRDMRNCYV